MSFQRIRILETKDVERLYPLLRSYIEHPALAYSVTEFFVDDENFEKGPFLFGDRNLISEDIATFERDHIHLALEQHAASLGFDEATTQRILTSLEQQAKKTLGIWRGPADESFRRTREFAAVGAVLLLSFCQNISTMYIGTIRRLHILVDFLLKANYGLSARPALQKLEKVKVVTSKTSSFMRDKREYHTMEFIELFQYFHRLPAIRSLQMEGLQEYEMKRTAFVPGTGNIKEIHLGHCHVCPDTVATLISIPKALEVFHFSIGGLWSMDGGSPLAISGSIAAKLRQHKDTLTKLVLDTDTSCTLGLEDLRRMSDRGSGFGPCWTFASTGHRLGDDVSLHGEEYLRMDEEASVLSQADREVIQKLDYGIPIGSLRDFKVLSHLRIGVQALMGPETVQHDAPKLETPLPYRLVNSLPPNLESFHLTGYIRGYNEDIDAHIDELIAERGHKLPKLADVQGLDETLADLQATYGGNTPLEEENLWVRPERDLNWKSV